jgi:hypothetical protein
MRTALDRFLQDPANDYYTADEDFLRRVWIPAVRRATGCGPPKRLPSHAYRRGVPTRVRAHDAAFRRFQRLPVPSGAAGRNDRESSVTLGDSHHRHP